MSRANEPAFPVDVHNRTLTTVYGLTKREYFAGLAMQGLLGNSMLRMDTKPAVLAEESARFADALLAELEKSQ